MKKVIVVMVSLMLALWYGISVFASGIPYEELELQFAEREAALKEQYKSGKITLAQYEEEVDKLSYTFELELSMSPQASFDVLEKEPLNTEKNSMEAFQYLESHRETESMLRYYADSKRKQLSETDDIPDFTFSEPKVLLLTRTLLGIGQGKMDVEIIRQYAPAWVFIGYADGEPFCVFQVSYSEEEGYRLSTVYPSSEQAEALECLLDGECYLLSPVSNSPVLYCKVEDDRICSVYERDVKTGIDTVISGDSKTTEQYFYARKLAYDENLKMRIASVGKSQLGGAANTTLTYQDTWNRAYYELYIRPYLIPVVIVLAIGTVIAAVIMIRKRKQKKV